jgi:hypothetical protein
LEFNTLGDGKLRLKGTLVQSQSGDEQPIGCFRGEYSSTTEYYKGDEVTYNGSAYRYINDSGQSGQLPTDTAYWAVIAARGGSGPSTVFCGTYSDSATYYGTDKRVDAVEYEGSYYVANTNAGDGFSGISPADTGKWSPFGASFENIATGLLLAEQAYVENLGVRRLATADEGRRILINKTSDTIEMRDQYNNVVVDLFSALNSDSTFASVLKLTKYDDSNRETHEVEISNTRIRFIKDNWASEPDMYFGWNGDYISIRLNPNKLKTSASSADIGEVYLNNGALMLRTS